MSERNSISKFTLDLFIYFFYFVISLAAALPIRRETETLKVTNHPIRLEACGSGEVGN